MTLVVFFMLIDMFVVAQVYSQEEKKQLFDEKRANLEKRIVEMENSIAFINEQERLGAAIKSNNIILKDSISNLFALIPDQIHLTRAKIDRDYMELYGYTPSKSIYNDLLMPPLKSIFNETTVVFYPLGNGWYRFVSKNRSKEDFLYEKQ
jgi:hypothetical protein